MNTFPWDNEPNELDFEADGLRCAMRRSPMLCWCGYVGVEQDHPWYGLPYNAIIKPTADMLENRSSSDFGIIDLFLEAMSDRDSSQGIPLTLALRAHGGIGWAEDRPGRGEPDGRWWFGFDCGHAGDLVPGLMHFDMKDTFAPFLDGDRMKEFEKTMFPIMESIQRNSIYRDVNYVVSECQQLAAQLVKIAETYKGAKVEWTAAPSEAPSEDKP